MKKTKKKKLTYPKSVFFIVSNEFCERFSFYGMRTVLVIYLTQILLYSDADAKIIYHSFTACVYFFPITGAIISDSFFGKFNTIFYVSMIYACGNLLMTLTSIEPIGIPQQPFTIVALLLMALGAGGIKPCVAAFGGDQFVLPQQALQLASFFSLFYFSINAGSLISTFLTPILRNDVHCFDKDSCFPIAFAVPGVLMIISIVVFACGKPFYKIKKTKGNIVVEVIKCISHAVGRKMKSTEKREHWLDYAEEQYGSQLIKDIKITLHVLVIYLPLPIFWALYDQQGSGWTLQAIRMNGDIGFYTILPDQMQVVNPVLILAFIPLFTYYVYPLFAKINLLKNSLHRMICGGFLAALAFTISALVSIAIEKVDPILASGGNIQLRIYNPTDCRFSINADILNFSKEVLPNEYSVQRGINIARSENIIFTFETNCPTYKSLTINQPIEEAKAYGIFITESNIRIDEDNIAKSETGLPLVRTLIYTDAYSVTYKNKKKSLHVNAGNYSLIEVPNPGKYSIEVNGTDTGKSIEFNLGGTYAVLLNIKNSVWVEKTEIVTEPNSVHILWLLPQYFIITAAEIMFSITGLEFSYSQAPVAMKSLLQACFLLTTAIGNLIIVAIESAKIFEKQSNDFFLFAGLMVVDMVLFTFLAMRYKFIKPDDTDVTTESLSENIEEKATKNGIENPSFVQN